MSIFGKPPTPTAVATPPLPPTMAAPSVRNAGNAAAIGAGASGFASTILTSPQGTSGNVRTGAKTLLGQ